MRTPEEILFNIIGEQRHDKAGCFVYQAIEALKEQVLEYKKHLKETGVLNTCQLCDKEIKYGIYCKQCNPYK